MCDEQQENVTINGVEYSVFCEIDVDYGNMVEAQCLECGENATTFPIKEIRINEVIDANAVTQKKPSKSLLKKIEKELRDDYESRHNVCETCADERINGFDSI